MRERLWILFACMSTKRLVHFPTAFSWLLMVRTRRSLWKELNLGGGSGVTSGTGDNFLKYFWVILMRGLCAPSVCLQTVPVWVGVLICLRYLDLFIVDWYSSRHSINVLKSSAMICLAWGILVTGLRTSVPRCPVCVLPFAICLALISLLCVRSLGVFA